MAILAVSCVSAQFTAKAILNANSRSNTNAPPDGAPWDNVGHVNDASGVYVGDGWVLNPIHVGGGSFTLNTGTYAYDGLFQQLTNADGSAADMVLFHVTPTPPNPPIALATSTPPVDTNVDMIGCGEYSGSAQTTFGSFTGFSWSPRAAKSWGDNKVSGPTTYFNDGHGNVTVFPTTFNSPGPGQTPNEAQATSGDSGGGVFRKTSAGWQLAGSIVLISQASGQPANTSVYGQDTYALDIATYRLQIKAIIASTPQYLTINRGSGKVQVCWMDLGLSHQLQYTTNLTNPTWLVVSQGASLTNGQFCVTLPTTNSATFFRLH